MNHIEVIGSSTYEEHPETILLDIEVFVRASKESSALSEIKAIINQIIDNLLQNGLTKDEVFFGGKETYTPWWKSNKVGVETRHKISIKSNNKACVYQALDTIDLYQNNKRIRIEIEERQPIYTAKDGAIDKAMQLAIQDAFNKATCLAKASKSNVGDVLEIQEISKEIRGSGSYGDHDFGDSYFGIAMAGGSVNHEADIEPAIRLEHNVRIVSLRYRVKYQLVQ